MLDKRVSKQRETKVREIKVTGCLLIAQVRCSWLMEEESYGWTNTQSSPTGPDTHHRAIRKDRTWPLT